MAKSIYNIAYGNWHCMKDNKTSQHSFISVKHYTLFVMFLCFIPHFMTAPWWISVIFLAVIGYLLVTDYFSYPIMTGWRRFCITAGCFSLLYGSIHSDNFTIDFFLIAVILKWLETHTVRDLKIFILCNFYLIFSSLIVIQQLWIIIYLFIGILANLSIMLKLSAPQASLRQIGSRSGKQLLIAIPISILLFYIFPRINPLWHVPFISQGRTGFSDTMSPGSIGMLFNDDSIAMQITFNKKPIFDGYWRGVILSYYSGVSWNSSWYKYSSFLPLPELDANASADYQIILEPDQTKWLFYEGYPIAGRPDLIFSPDHGLIRQNKEAIAQRFAYSLNAQSAPKQVLSAAEYAESTQLPSNINPRLNAWAKDQFAKSQENIQAFITFLQDYIHQQPFWYTLAPPGLNPDKNQMDSFWFDTQKGYCEYYASAITYILRAAGIPARVVIGYHGGQWNPITHAITIRQYDAHAWLEYWVNGIGWQQLDPTSFIAIDRIDRTIRSRQVDLLYQQGYFSISAMPWQREIGLFLDSARFFAERWFLFYNEDTQLNLLQQLGLGQWQTGQLFQASVACMILFFILLGLAYYLWQRRAPDSLLLEYHSLQKEFRRFNISTHPSATLKIQCNSLINKAPDLAPVLSAFIDRYDQLRLKQGQHYSKENKKETIALFKMLRKTLRRTKIT